MNCPVCLNKKIATFETLNSECICSTPVSPSYTRFSSQTPLFISRDIADSIQERVRIVEKVVTSEAFRSRVSLQEATPTGGILMSYDFHLQESTPKLIEINTNAGGFFLNYEFLKNLHHCCANTHTYAADELEKKTIEMFRGEFSKVHPTRELSTVAIMDENPSEQFLYPDFLICKDILERHGIKVFIADPKDVEVQDGKASVLGTPIDLIYNRVTDFYFAKAEHAHLQPLTHGNETVISPGPEDYKLFADKSNFLHLEDTALQKKVLSDAEVAILRETIPETVRVRVENEENLWENRKSYFFKPLNGFGGKGAYNGKGLTKKVWEDIKHAEYIAQEIVRPSTKGKEVDGQIESFKYDIRAFAYRGEVLLISARLYQGQTTNFRTPGGGFAPVFITSTP